MDNQLLSPDFIFETSWEVCNRVGGIYAVLSTRAKTLQEYKKDKTLFIGPDIWQGKDNPFFKETKTSFSAWKKYARDKEGLCIRTGRWNIPGNPLVVLVDFKEFFPIKNTIYAEAWKAYGVDSLNGYGDYDEACTFAYAAARVMESFYNFHLKEEKNVIAHFNEWTTGIGGLYIKKYLPQIATIFTTHATTVGRSIAGNGKPLYDYLPGYFGDQMARELNVEAKHSVEKHAALQADCFTTVSDITAKECAQLLRPVDIVTPNGFEDGFVPRGETFKATRAEARKALISTAEQLFGYSLPEDIFIIGTSGRNEFKNKGLDAFLDALKKVNQDQNTSKEILAYILVPSDLHGVRQDLKERMTNPITGTAASLCDPFLSHWLNHPQNDSIYRTITHHNLTNKPNDRVKVVYVPCYLNGDDGLFNKSYYDLLIGMDMTAFPSYYEPWGYTPLESIAFYIPTVTTDLSGFGLWAKKEEANISEFRDAVSVLHRTDKNYEEVVEEMANLFNDFLQHSPREMECIRKTSRTLSNQALWKHFIQYYYQAYHIALTNRNKRNQY